MKIHRPVNSPPGGIIISTSLISVLEEMVATAKALVPKGISFNTSHLSVIVGKQLGHNPGKGVLIHLRRQHQTVPLKQMHQVVSTRLM